MLAVPGFALLVVIASVESGKAAKTYGLSTQPLICCAHAHAGNAATTQTQKNRPILLLMLFSPVSERPAPWRSA
jgi:hypothetical protein